MDTQTPDMQAVVERLGKVERHKWTLKTTAVVILALAAGSCVAPPPESVSAPLLGEAEILALLPEGAQMAKELPILEPATADREERRLPCIVYADVDGDEEDEIVVAYYAAPPSKDWPEGEKEAVAYERWYETKARVRVLSWNGGKYATQRDIGCGAQFVSYNNKPVPAELEPYIVNSFGVRDITGDGNPDIICTTYGCLATGADFGVWCWDGKEYKRIAIVGEAVRIEDIDDDGAHEIVVDRRRGKQLDVPIVYEWDGESFKKRAD